MYAASDDLRAELAGHRISFSGWPGYTVGAAPQLVRHDRHLIDDLVATMAGLADRGVTFRGEPVDEGWGIVVTMVLPGEVEMMLYQSRHQTAI